MKPVKLKLRPHVRLEADAESRGGMLFDTHTAAICACNESAWTAAQALQRGADAEAIASLLVEIFEVERPQVRKDVMTLLREMRALDLLDG
jgi:hypothetical protein